MWISVDKALIELIIKEIEEISAQEIGDNRRRMTQM
jgi:hypothetical protein